MEVEFDISQYEGKMFQFEDTELYLLIARSSRASLRRAWIIAGQLPDEKVTQRSETDQSSYLHHVVNQAPSVYDKYGTVNVLVPLIYRLAIRGVNVCAQNSHGNTCLHLACLRPHADTLCAHLIRIGVDPCILNHRGCRVIHIYRNNLCHMVKGQANAICGIWSAVEHEDVELVAKLLRSWCRVDVRRNKTLLELADETSNVALSRLLERHQTTGELVMAAFACDIDRVRSILRRSRNTLRRTMSHRGSDFLANRDFMTCTRSSSAPRTQRQDLIPGQVDLTQCDESCEVPKPLIVALKELGSYTHDIIRILEDAGAVGNADDYAARLATYRSAFETSKIFQLIVEGTEGSLNRALEVIQSGEFN
jgi:hypothetical protein